jgi:hypothetical protein
VFCLEAARDRFDELRARYAPYEFVHPYNASSVEPADYAEEEEVRDFHRAVPTALNAFPLEEVLRWRDAELAYLASSGIAVDGIDRIRREHAVEEFDCVLLDGSEFTARAELELVYGARWVLLDDVNSFKNHANCLRLLDDPRYRLVDAGPRLRNGYAVFERLETASR